jgi:bifunctional non-homologous end joining protein LigD
LWLANQDTIEFHPWHSRINPEQTGLPTIFINSTGTLEMSVLNYPDWLLFDIDPSQAADDQTDTPEAGFDRARQAALLVHQLLTDLGLQHLVKLSGKRGVHIFIPLQRLYPFDQVRQVAKKLSERLVDKHDDIFTTEWHIDKRQGRVFLDWQQNARGKSVVAPYSLRATDKATVSAPVSWPELTEVQPQKFTLESVSRQLVKLPAAFWPDLADQAQELPAELIG